MKWYISRCVGIEATSGACGTSNIIQILDEMCSAQKKYSEYEQPHTEKKNPGFMQWMVQPKIGEWKRVWELHRKLTPVWPASMHLNYNSGSARKNLYHCKIHFQVWKIANRDWNSKKFTFGQTERIIPWNLWLVNELLVYCAHTNKV